MSSQSHALFGPCFHFFKDIYIWRPGQLCLRWSTLGIPLAVSLCDVVNLPESSTRQRVGPELDHI